MLILASNSPRRRELLQQISCDFICYPSNAPEISAEEEPNPQKLVQQNAVLKAKATVDSLDKSTYDLEKTAVLGADTIVFYNGKIFGKPHNNEDAFNMLKTLSGKTHQVYTGIALCKNNMILQDFCVTDVTMKTLSDEEIRKYIDSGEPQGKAGAYAIQGLASVFIEKINGCYFNVVGLPLNCLYNLVQKADIQL